MSVLRSSCQKKKEINDWEGSTAAVIRVLRYWRFNLIKYILYCVIVGDMISGSLHWWTASFCNNDAIILFLLLMFLSTHISWCLQPRWAIFFFFFGHYNDSFSSCTAPHDGVTAKPIYSGTLVSCGWHYYFVVNSTGRTGAHGKQFSTELVCLGGRTAVKQD